MPFTSSSLVVSNFALCVIPFLAVFYSKGFILGMFSLRYVNIQEGNELQRQKILMFVYTIYYYKYRNINTVYIYIYIYIYNKTNMKRNILTIK
jgi:hypothetical protein